VATGALNPGDIAYPIRALSRKRRIHFRHGEAERIDTANRQLLLAGGASLAYDYLVLACGAAVNYFDVEGAAEHSAALYTRGEAITLRDRLMGELEQLASGDASRGLVAVVVGGGPTGVEMAGALAELRDTALTHAFPELDPKTIRVVLVERADELLAPFHPALRAYARSQLERRSVELRLAATISSVATGAVHFEDGSSLRSDLTVWAAGVTVAAQVRGFGLPLGRGGRIEVDGDLRVRGEERIFAVGDVALSGERLPQLAQPAIQMGRHAGRQIAALLAGGATEAFAYRDKGTMATIGRRAAVAELRGGIRLRGTLAWGAWLALHIVTLLGNRSRASALLNLTWRYVAWPSGSGVIVGDIAEEPPAKP